ncbi:hypothetical protein GCM10023097_50140 [Streptomyces collinus]
MTNSLDGGDPRTRAADWAGETEGTGSDSGHVTAAARPVGADGCLARCDRLYHLLKSNDRVIRLLPG